MVLISTLNGILTCTSILGLCLSIYQFRAEKKFEQDSSYQPVCDINDRISCSKTYKSPYGKGCGIFPTDSIFYISNSLYGCFFYSFMLILAHSSSVWLTTFVYGLIILSNLLNVYFAYLLIFKIQTICIVCISIYVVNFIMLVSMYYKNGMIRERDIDHLKWD